jgi:hypothetical protein
MRIATRFSASRAFTLATVVLLGWLATSPARARAQITNGGYNVVTSGVGTLPTSTFMSTSFIDASAYGVGDICSKIYSVFTHTTGIPYPPAGAVIDARGISNLQCSGNTPWVNGGVSTSFPSVILLPTGTITIGASWVLPDNTRIIGTTIAEGSTGTIIQAVTPNIGPMIQMGSQTLCPGGACHGVAVENLMLDGVNRGGVAGIQNEFSEELSYVNNVNLFRIEGIGLDIETAVNTTGANNSGPYSNISFAETNGTPQGCVKILNARTRGVHGLTCLAGGTNNGVTSAAVDLSGSGNSIEDFHFEGFKEGVAVGADQSASGNVLLNITGSDTNGMAHISDIVHIYSFYSGTSDLSILAVNNEATPGTNTIQDDVTSTTLTDQTLGMYALGESIATGGVTGGYSRFTTSPNIPSFSSGKFGMATPVSSCAVGSLLSNTTASSHGTTLWVCVPGSTWVALPIP